MRIHSLPLGCLFLFGFMTGYSTAQAPPKDREVPSVQSILREASELALKQGSQEKYSLERVLLQIADQQIHAGDLEGALRSVRGSSYSSDRNPQLIRLVEAFARAGNKDRATEVSRLIEPGCGLTQDQMQQIVQVQWVRHLIAKGELQQASTAIEQIKSPKEHHEALRKLAVACSRIGDEAQATKYFTQAIEAAKAITRDYDRACALWETAYAQRLIGDVDKAQATLLQSVENANDFKDARTKAWALSECAVIATKLKENETAQLLFDRAIKSLNAVDVSNEMKFFNKLVVIEHIAVNQASVGFIDEARKTASIIEHSEIKYASIEYSDGALCAIVVAQIKSGDAAGAVNTALSLKYCGDYRDDALNDIVAYQIGKCDLKAALITTEKIENPSRKAVAILKVASAQTKAGDRKAAGNIAAQIKLTHRSELQQLPNADNTAFDYRNPKSWIERYDALPFFTSTSYLTSIRSTAEVAAAAMELAQALDYKPVQSYAEIFNEADKEVVQSLARAHAAFGDPKEAVAWAKQIGSGEKIPEEDKNRVTLAVRRRIHALLGVAEGMLDRSKQ